jgi:hypothetical protein
MQADNDTVAAKSLEQGPRGTVQVPASNFLLAHPDLPVSDCDALSQGLRKGITQSLKEECMKEAVCILVDTATVSSRLSILWREQRTRTVKSNAAPAQFLNV